MEYFTRITPSWINGRMYLRVETKRKEEGNFQGLALPSDKEYSKKIIKVLEPEWIFAK
jgi:hypothetical protein